MPVSAQRFEDIRAAGFTRNAAIAMFGHARAGCRADEHAGRRNIEGVRTIAAGADDIDKVAVIRDVHRGGEFAHDGGRRRDFADGLFFDA